MAPRGKVKSEIAACNPELHFRPPGDCAKAQCTHPGTAYTMALSACYWLHRDHPPAPATLAPAAVRPSGDLTMTTTRMLNTPR